MMKNTFICLIALGFAFSPSTVFAQRKPVDTVGFAQHKWQMDSIYARIPDADKITVEESFGAAICPHDDYAYAAGLYVRTLAGIKAGKVILIGVSHKAKQFGIDNKLVFDSFREWECAGGNIKVSNLREKLLEALPKEYYTVNDSMMQAEHSLEAITPFLKRNNEGLEILPILVPYMTFENMKIFSEEMARIIFDIITRENISFGPDLAIVISNDGLHYGDTGWNGSNMAPYGTDAKGTSRAAARDIKIIDDCLKGKITVKKVKRFFTSTVSADNYREYKWTWCGRYSVPFGMLLATRLNQLCNNSLLYGEVTGYRSSITTPHIEVADLKMGTTAPANERHWVSYVGVVFK
jgi:AmmeMemoRadiSam system protein B